MFVSKPYSESTYRRNKEEPAWHPVKEPFHSFSKVAKAVCGLEFTVGEPTILKKKLPKGARYCGQCRTITEGRKLRAWASTGQYR